MCLISPESPRFFRVSFVISLALTRLWWIQDVSREMKEEEEKKDKINSFPVRLFLKSNHNWDQRHGQAQTSKLQPHPKSLSVLFISTWRPESVHPPVIHSWVRLPGDLEKIHFYRYKFLKQCRTKWENCGRRPLTFLSWPYYKCYYGLLWHGAREYITPVHTPISSEYVP